MVQKRLVFFKLLRNSMFPAKEAPASSHMLVSRAERGLQATIWSSGRTSKHFWCKKKACFLAKQCFRPRKLLPVVICLSHGLSEVFRPRSGVRLGLRQSHGVQAPGEGAGCVIGLRLDSEARLRGGAATCGAAGSAAAGAQREVLGLRGVVHVVGGARFRPFWRQGALPSICAKKACFSSSSCETACFLPRKLQ